MAPWTHRLLPAALLASLGASLLASLGGCRSTEPIGPHEHAFSTEIPCPGVECLAEVEPGLYRSGHPTPEGYAALKRLGVKTVMNTRVHHRDRKAALAAGLDEIWFPLHASILGCVPPTREEVDRFLAIAVDPEKRPLVFHCHDGRERSGALAAIYRIEVQGWSAQEALWEMYSLGFRADVNRTLERYIKDYRPSGKWLRAPARQ